jgi:hypothetical protein
MSAFYTDSSQEPVPCGHLLFTVLHVSMQVQYTQGFSTADDALTHVAHVTTAA